MADGYPWAAGDELTQSALKAATFGYGTTGGSSNAYTLTFTTTPAAYFTGMTLIIKANFANTAAATINVNSLGAKSIKKYNGQALDPDDIRSGDFVHMVYDGTNFEIIGILREQKIVKRQHTDGTQVMAQNTDYDVVSFTVPAIGANDMVIVRFEADIGAAGVNNTYKIKIGATATSMFVVTLADKQFFEVRIMARNDTSAQYVDFRAISENGVAKAGSFTLSETCGSDFTVAVTLRTASAGSPTGTVSFANVQVIKG